jgi:hypothetical protein
MPRGSESRPAWSTSTFMAITAKGDGVRGWSTRRAHRCLLVAQLRDDGRGCRQFGMAELRRFQSPHHRHIEDPRRRLPQHRQPGNCRGAEEGDQLRPRARRRQLRVADRGAGLQGALLSELRFQRPARDQHERRHEGRDQHHEQVSCARRMSSCVRHGTRQGDQARRAGAPVRGGSLPTSRCCASTVRDGAIVYNLNGLAADPWDKIRPGAARATAAPAPQTAAALRRAGSTKAATD